MVRIRPWTYAAASATASVVAGLGAWQAAVRRAPTVRQERTGQERTGRGCTGRRPRVLAEVLGASAAGAVAVSAGLWLASVVPGLRQGRWRLVLADLGPAARGGLPGREGSAVTAIAARAGFPMLVLPAGRAGERTLGGHGWSPASGLRQVTVRHVDVDGTPGSWLDVEVHVGDVPPPWAPGLALGSGPVVDAGQAIGAGRAGPSSSPVAPEHRDVAALPPVTVIVDGAPVAFEARADGPDGWVAFGSIPGAWIRLRARGVPAEGLALVRPSGRR